MNRTSSISDPLADLAALQAQPDAVPWPERRELARALAVHLRSGELPHWVVPMAEVLARDPKPEVRQAVANSLHLFDDGTLAKLAARLAEDSNAFVRKAAERSLDRRRRGQRDAERTSRKVQQVQSEFEAIARMHGSMAAERAQAMAERFADVVVGTTAYNLGGVITSLKLKASALAQEIENSAPDQRKARSVVLAITERIAFLERLVNDMNEYARPLSNERRRERLAGIIEEAHRLAIDAAPIDKQTTVSIPYACTVPECITVEIVRHQLLMAMTNILKNAYESLMDRDGGLRPGSIAVSAEVRTTEVIITVSDTGGGLDARDLAELREFVLGRTSKKNRRTGYGLPIARRYVTAHGGSLAIDSQLNYGTTMTVILPIEQEEI